MHERTKEVAFVAKDMDKLNLYLIDDTGHKTEQIHEHCKKLQPDFIFLDYCQLMSRYDFLKTHEAIAEVLAYFKKLCKRYNVGIIVMSQISRTGMLKSSGSLEEVADTVMELSWTGRDDSDKDIHDYVISVTKQRHGPVKAYHCQYYPEYFMFADVNAEGPYERQV